jgi:hypothetical protein
VDIERLSEYRLVAPFKASDISSTTFGWRAVFEIEMPYAHEIVVDGLAVELERYKAIIHEIHITPLTLKISISSLDPLEHFGLSAGFGENYTKARVLLNTADGATIETERRWITVFYLDEQPEFEEMLLIIGDPVNLDDIVSIQIDDIIITLP